MTNKKINNPRAFLDQSVYWRLCRDMTGAKVEKWNESILSKGVFKSGQSVHFLSTPFTFLEAAGIKAGKLSSPKTDIPQDLLKANDPEIIKLHLYEKALEFYSKHILLQPKFLIDKFEGQKRNIPKFGQRFFEDIFGKDIRKPGFESGICQALASDFLLRAAYPKDVQELMFGSFLIDIMRVPAYGHNFSQARLIKPHWKILRNHLIDEKALTEAEARHVEDNNWLFKDQADLVDTEITHLAVNGWYSPNGLSPVYCFTCDSANVVRFRIGLYKWLSSLSEKFVRDTQKSNPRRKMPFKPLALRSGLVFIWGLSQA